MAVQASRGLSGKEVGDERPKIWPTDRSEPATEEAHDRPTKWTSDGRSGREVKWGWRQVTNICSLSPVTSGLKTSC